MLVVQRLSVFWRWLTFAPLGSSPCSLVRCCSAVLAPLPLQAALSHSLCYTMTSYALGLNNYYIFNKFVGWVCPNKQAITNIPKNITKFGSYRLDPGKDCTSSSQVGWFMV